MFDNDWKSELLKAAAMLVVVATEWWMMQPYHEPILARMWLTFAKFCYTVARRFGSLGLIFEHNYYLAV